MHQHSDPEVIQESVYLFELKSYKKA